MSEVESEAEILPNLSQTLVYDISELYLEADDYNVNLHIGYEPNVEIFKAHSVILRARSSYFRAALNANWSCTSKDNVYIFKKPNISPKVFRTILKYIYTGSIDFDASIVEENLVELLHAADELTLLELVESIQDHIIFMDSEWLEKNCDKLLKSIMHNQMLKKLRKFCEDFMSSVPEKFFKLYDFSGLEEEMLFSLIKHEGLQMAEVDIWEALTRWGISNLSLSSDLKTWTSEDFETLENALHKFIPHIRFFQMEHRDYYFKVRPLNQILPKELKEDLEMYFIIPDCKPSSQVLPPRNNDQNSMIISINHKAFLASWINGNNETISLPYPINCNKLNTLLRGSRDGFDFATFQKRCFEKGPTILVVKVKGSGKIIGGYNPFSWSGSKGYLSSKDSFTFCFDEKFDLNKTILSRVKEESFAILDNFDENVGFGRGDLQVFKKITTKRYYSKELLDHKTFEIEEFEVFQVIK
ncbi:hypothetical protein Glove_51g58 [Diversispora epigaea]|uniref:BTB domain-containing protein n=1 Tax=Diversispora epigaea TaxID=1348612 RepID=A0A397JHZ2_9GLOM|nr:hypothetical protein Glove_51g58 [Diversispora epigaea]